MISNISFIVIAKNEEFAIKKCLESICNFPLSNCEVICVDSGSTDNTLSIMLEYKDEISNFSVLKLEGEVNASVARNAGLKLISKKYVFFIDGDVSLDPDFIFKALQCFEVDFEGGFTGELCEIVYSDDYSKIIKPLYVRRSFKKKKPVRATGGILILRKNIIDKVGLFNESYTRAQDIDYTLRYSLYSNIIALPMSMGTHHTKLYKKRGIDFLKNKYPMFMGSIFRKNIYNYDNLKELMLINRGPITGIFFYFTISLALISFIFNIIPYLFLSISLVVFSLDMLICKFKHRSFVNTIVENYFSSLFILFGFFIEKKNILNYSINKIC